MKIKTKKIKLPNYKRKDKRTLFFLTMPSFVILFILTVVPLVFSLGISMFDYNITNAKNIKFVGLANFIRAVRDNYFTSAILVTVIQVAATVAGQMVLGMLIALLLSREFKGAKIMRSLYIIPMMITPVVSGIMWRMMFNADLGIVNYMLGKLGVPSINWLGSPGTALATIIITDIWLSTPFVTMILLAGIQAISNDYYDAAAMDGVNTLQKFCYITLPLTKPMVLLALLFRIMDAIRRYDSIMAMTAGGPGISTQTLNIYAYYQGFSYFNIGYSSALSMILLISIFVISIILLKKIRKAG
ncbi:carbohydrate ABC transporter permease [uncultured Robinsoniella sp.]|uniref:carbohydrate ABC transporter permease n=1 Tax=uncultured Robinsoniella sp. TaxID=904190 RepID=UPI00374EBFAE